MAVSPLTMYQIIPVRAGEDAAGADLDEAVPIAFWNLLAAFQTSIQRFSISEVPQECLSVTKQLPVASNTRWLPIHIILGKLIIKRACLSSICDESSTKVLNKPYHQISGDWQLTTTPRGGA